MRQLPIALLFPLGLAACAPPAPPPSAPPPQVAPGTASVRPTAAMLDPYVGSYRSGAETMEIRRVGDALTVDRPGQAPLVLALVGLGTFADDAGNSWLFARLANAARLTVIGADGSRREWTR